MYQRHHHHLETTTFRKSQPFLLSIIKISILCTLFQSGHPNSPIILAKGFSSASSSSSSSFFRTTPTATTTSSYSHSYNYNSMMNSRAIISASISTNIRHHNFLTKSSSIISSRSSNSYYFTTALNANYAILNHSSRRYGNKFHSRIFSSSTTSLSSSSSNNNNNNNNNNNDNTSPSSPPSSYYTPPDPQRLADLMPEKDPITGRVYTTYEKCVRRLYLTNLFHPVKLGLQNMEQLHKELGDPMDKKSHENTNNDDNDKNGNNISVIHVAGTNGKGSVSFKIAKAFENAGYKVGLFVSPHISSFRERMQINSIPISEQEVEQLLPAIYDICESNEIPATFFEVTTALAFSFFDKNDVDVVVLETGLGGRLDATNVVVCPDLSVITSIGLEHTRILGDTIELIAKEKAGIMKKGAPVLVGPDVPHDVMKQCAIEKQADGYYTCEDVLGESIMKDNPEEVVLNGVTYVDYDIQNAMIAKAALQLLDTKNRCSNVDFPFDSDVIEKGIQHRPPCRFEKRLIRTDDSTTDPPVTVILDVAHNPPAMKHLVSKLEATYPNREKRIVVGFSADKDLAQCGKSLLSIVQDPSRLHLVEAAHPRAAKLEDILVAEPKLKESNFDEEDRSITAQVKSALSIADKNNEILVICGSVFLMAEAREAIGIDEPKDSGYIAEVAGANLRHGQEFFANSDPEKDGARQS